jgi:hypothetical protein
MAKPCGRKLPKAVLIGRAAIGPVVNGPVVRLEIVLLVMALRVVIGPVRAVGEEWAEAVPAITRQPHRLSMAKRLLLQAETSRP